MFNGLSNLNINASGRITIPTKYRDDINAEHDGKMVLTVDFGDRCLVLYPKAKWLDTEQALMSLPTLSRTAIAIKRLIQGHATDVEMDGQGRIIIPSSLREYANLEKKLAFVGQGDKFEIWNEDSWGAGRDQWVIDAPINIQNDDDLKNFSI